MLYSEFLKVTELSKQQLLAHAYGQLIVDAPGQMIRIPAPPMLMLDRVTDIQRQGTRGFIAAERDVKLDDWFFNCHFVKDPVQPGCLGVDAIWQMIGLYLSLMGRACSGRALGCKEVEFSGQIRPYNKLVRYEVDIQRYTNMPDKGVSMAIGTGRVYVDGELIYKIKDAKVGSFKDIAYEDYPEQSANSIGGLMIRE